MGTNSDFGKEFDSLADVVSFGIAPAVLGYAWGVRAMAAADSSPALHLTELGWLIGFFFVGCCAWRLARFNVKGMASGGNRYFVGMPTPAAAGMIAAVVHAFRNPIDDSRISLLWLALIAALGILMSSTLRHYSFKDIQWTKRQPSLAIVLWAALIGTVIFLSRPALLAIATAYTLHGIVLQVVRFARHRPASRTA
jgi:CDP-diacylglycerol--serine O-phosphatidyltransferase